MRTQWTRLNAAMPAVRFITVWIYLQSKFGLGLRQSGQGVFLLKISIRGAAAMLVWSKGCI
jgi:hypothetical protein